MVFGDLPLILFHEVYFNFKLFFKVLLKWNEEISYGNNKTLFKAMMIMMIIIILITIIIIIIITKKIAVPDL